MPYCNQCGRYIGGGMFCDRCGDTGQNTNEETCRGLDGMPTPDCAPPETEDINYEEVPSDIDTSSIEDDNMDVARGAHVPGDDNREVVSEGRTIVTGDDEEHHDTPPTDAKQKKRGPMRRLFSIFGEKLCREDNMPYSEKEAKRGRFMAVLCYLGILWAIPYFCARSSRYISYHLERGLNLLLLECLGFTCGAAALFMGVVIPVLMPLLAATAEVVLLVAVAGSMWNVVRIFAARRGSRSINGTQGRVGDAQ